MLGNLKTLDSRLLKKQCVECGYDGTLLRGGMAARCPRCGCDLRQRPARSYAEMEGLLDLPLPVIVKKTKLLKSTAGTHREQLIYRWLALLFTSMLLVIGIVYLTAALVPG